MRKEKSTIAKEIFRSCGLVRGLQGFLGWVCFDSPLFPSFAGPTTRVLQGSWAESVIIQPWAMAETERQKTCQVESRHNEVRGYYGTDPPQKRDSEGAKRRIIRGPLILVVHVVCPFAEAPTPALPADGEATGICPFLEPCGGARASKVPYRIRIRVGGVRYTRRGAWVRCFRCWWVVQSLGQACLQRDRGAGRRGR